MTEHENKFWAFLSYSQKDNCAERAGLPSVIHRCWADWLQEALRSFAVPAEFIGQVNGRGELVPERIAPIFQDASEQAYSPELTPEARQALENSICLIVICSPRSALSQPLNETVRYFKQLGRGHRILPFVIAGEPHATDGNRVAADECFVPALRHPVLPDGTLDTSRLAGKFIFVDARYGAEKREILAADQRDAEADLEMAKVQLIALLLSVGFNGLWCREQRRHFFEFAEARQQAQRALAQVAEIQQQLSAAQNQAQAAQRQALELQNLPGDVAAQIEMAQAQAREAQQQLQAVQGQIHATESQLTEARQQAQDGKRQLQEFQQQLRFAHGQMEAVRQQVVAAENEADAARTRALAAEQQLQTLRQLSPELTAQIQVAKQQSQAAQAEAEQTQRQLVDQRRAAQTVHDQLLAAQQQAQEFQQQAQTAQSQLAEARQQVLAAQAEVVAAQSQARETQDKIQEIQNQNRHAQTQIAAAQNEVQKNQQRSHSSGRLIKVWAVLAALALLAAGWAARQAAQQREAARQALARAESLAAGRFEVATNGLNPEGIRQLLQQIGGAEQAQNRRASLNEIVARISSAEIPAALQTSAVMVDGESRSYFQLALLDRWLPKDLPAALRWACALPDSAMRSSVVEKILTTLTAPATTEQSVALNQIVVQWAQQDSRAALRLASQHSELFGVALEEITRAWFPNEIVAQSSGNGEVELLPASLVPFPWTKWLANVADKVPPSLPADDAAESNTDSPPTQVKSPE